MNAEFLNECMAYTLRRRNIAAPTFDAAGLRVYKRHDFNAKAVFSAIGKGGYVLPEVDASALDGGIGRSIYCAILSINRPKDELTIYNPISDKEAIVNLPAFLKHWTESGGDCITAFPTDKDTFNPPLTDLSAIELPSELSDLCDALAEHLHNAWAVERQSEGWTYGRERNDNRLETPDMVPYAQLPETEKQYDRIMAENTIKLLMAKGFRLMRDSD